MDQPPHQFESQQIVLRRQSRHLNERTDKLTELSSFDLQHSINQKPQQENSSLLTGNACASLANSVTSKHQSVSIERTKNAAELQSNQLPVSKPSNAHIKLMELASDKQESAGGPSVIPNFTISLPQSTTAATAPKLSAEDMLMALEPISKNN